MTDRERKAMAIARLAAAVAAKQAVPMHDPYGDTREIAGAIDMEIDTLRRVEIEPLLLVVQDLAMLCRRATAKLGGHELKRQIESYLHDVVPQEWR